MKRSGDGVMVSERCERPQCRRPVHGKVVNMVSLMLCIVYHDLKKKCGGRKGSEEKRREGRKGK